MSRCGCANAISLARSSFQAIGVAQASGRLIYSAVPLDKRSRETGPWWTGLHELGSHKGGFHPTSLATEIRLAAAVALLPAQPLLAMRRVYQLPVMTRTLHARGPAKKGFVTRATSKAKACGVEFACVFSQRREEMKSATSYYIE